MHPVFALFMDVPPESIDVNIHPTKREVDLIDEADLVSALSVSCREILLVMGRAKSPVREVFYFNEGGTRENRGGDYGPGRGAISDDIFITQGAGQAEEGSSPMRRLLKDAFYVGSYKDKYILFEAGGALIVMDQHAAHERINYERLKAGVEAGNVEVQRIIEPLVIALDSIEMDIWVSGQDRLEEMGFPTTKWDERSIALHGYPPFITKPAIAVRSLLSGKGLESEEIDTLARKACRGSVLAGEKLNVDEALQLRDDLLECSVPFVCPHGRPTVVEFSESFFDRQFLR